jgi:CubicO group peptidase (beta-lactamase class C family)
MKLLRRHLLHLADVPRDLDAVTTIDRRREVEPASVDLSAADVEAIWRRVRRLYRCGHHPGIALCVRYRGKVVLSRAIGHASGNGPDDPAGTPKVLLRPDTPFCLFSASKAITALLMHMLAEDGLINVVDPVAFYAPEFARHGKGNITIHQILSHRGGIPGLPAGSSLDVLVDADAAWDLLCDAKPIVADGSRLSYHAITGGLVLERITRLVTGESLNAYIERRIRKPMGMRYFRYGATREWLPLLPPSYATGPRPDPLLRMVIKRALGTGDVEELADICNDPRFHESPIPSGNLIGTAEEVARFFQMMLDGGRWRQRRICDPRTVARAVQEVGVRTLDQTLLIPLRYSAGMMLGDEPFGVWGPHSRQAFGHIGLINKLAWADPERELSVALLNSGLPFLGHHLPFLFDVVRTIGRRIPRDPDATPLGLRFRESTA